tara:strand:- start:264 stop:446 length:183 start_codon:yes stop_codon:yes gene_type:complete
MHIGEFGRLFMPNRVGVITSINKVEDTLVYDVLFFVGYDGIDGNFCTLRLFDEDLMLIAF